MVITIIEITRTSCRFILGESKRPFCLPKLKVSLVTLSTEIIATPRISPTTAPKRPKEKPSIRNIATIFPGSVPIYRGSTLVGGIGVSGDGIEQDDMVSFLGLHEAGQALGGSIGNAPKKMRADQLKPQGTRLRYVQCPQSPYIDSDAARVCDGK